MGNVKRYAKTIQGIHSGSVTARNRQNTELQDPLKEFLDENKRMGPHSQRLSRALLDSLITGSLLTEQRYAGRLIYSGGDDV